MNPIANDILMHYGIKRRSGRYPWGSGENPYQHSGDFLSRVEELRSQDFTYTDDNGKTWTGDTAIAKSMGLKTTEFRTQVSLANEERRALLVDTAKGLRAKGYSLNEIAAEMGYNNDSSVRSLLNENSEVRMNQARQTAEILKQQVDEKGVVDVGAGVERELNVSRGKLEEALYILKFEEGYETYGGRIDQVTNPGKKTTIKVLCPPGTPASAAYDTANIHSIKDYVSHDDGETYDKSWVYPKSMDSSRLSIRYAEDGGTDKDGVVEIRRGVDDLSLGESHYAQVRILVDDTHYIKGMAVYSDDLPDGVDVVFNTNKKKGTALTDVLKEIKDDPDNPFGSLIKDGVEDPDNPSSKKGGQSYYYDENGVKQLSLINKRSDEGDWGDWSNKVPSQFLAKQSLTLINKQLNLTVADKQAEYDEICSLTNPTLKKYLLKSFADDCDAAAIHLKAAALPRQSYQVILPLTTISDNEIYAPNYKDGETVALIRYPHGGTFEIPILKVNNKQSEGVQVIGSSAKDAVGINSTVAARLSGADFDGDTVMVIPCNSSSSNVKITSTPALKGLEGFDPKMEYGTVKQGDSYYNSSGTKIKVMTNTQNEMGRISNLIMDMTLKGATQDELARAVRHSMVVIDAEKHKLDYKQSEKDNGIEALKKKYQAHEDDDGYGGAATLITRAKSQTSVPKRKGSAIINEDGSLTYKESGETYTNKSGDVVVRMQKSTKMAETSDAHTLSSGTPQEEAYAEYANKMKAMANDARKTMINAGKIEYSSSAKATYEEVVKKTKAELNVALKNAPRERQAQVIANTEVNAKKQANPDMTKAEIKKASQQALTRARTAVGAKRETVAITDDVWEAIQAGAFSESTLTKILENTDIDVVKKYATPHDSTALSTAKINRIKAYSKAGYTNAQIAEIMGISSSTVSKYLN